MIEANAMETFCVDACLQGGTGEKKTGRTWKDTKAIRHVGFVWSTRPWHLIFMTGTNVLQTRRSISGRDTKVNIGAVVVDHPQLDKFTAGSRI